MNVYGITGLAGKVGEREVRSSVQLVLLYDVWRVVGLYTTYKLVYEFIIHKCLSCM